MIESDVQQDWMPEQRQRLAEFDVAQCVDIHCHVLPGLDDGPADISQAVALCAALAADGITTVCATPHQLGRYDRVNSAEVIRQGIEQLREVLQTEQIPLNILLGGDVRIDERLGKLLRAGEVVSLAEAGRHLLIELPHELLVDPVPTIEMLCEQGLQPIMTHPERHPYLAGKERLLQDWVRRGAVIQLTAGSLLGDFGRRAYKQAWQLLELGLASIVATDAHDVRRRPPAMTRALACLKNELSNDIARTLCIDNPLRVLQGEPIATPEPQSADA